MTETRQAPDRTAQEPPAEADLDEHRDWRGVAAEDSDDIPAQTSIMLRDRSRRLLGQLLRPYARMLWFVLAVVVVENAARLAVPYIVKEGIDRGIPPVVAGQGSETLFTIVAVLLGAVIVQAVARRYFLIRSGEIGQAVLTTLRRRMFGKFHTLSPDFHDAYTSGRVISRQTSDMEAINEMLETGFDGLVSAFLTLVGTAILLLTLDLKLGAVALLCFPFLWWITVWFRNSSAKAYRRTRETVAVVIVHFVETMTGMRAVQAFRREGRNQEIFAGVNDDYRDANMRAFRLVGVFMPGIKLIGNITIAIVLIYGSYLAFDGEVTVGVLAAFLLYLRAFFEPMMEISQFFNTFQSASAALEKLSGVLEEEPTVPEPVAPTRLGHVRGELAFEGMTFAYTEGRPVIDDLNLRVPAGETLALVGTTGAGKTTIAKLMARFYDPGRGRVTLDGLDLRDVSDHDLRRAVVMVTQENYLFNGSVADNIRLGRPEATRDEVIAAARAIGAHEFIEAMPEGYDTDVANNGGRLSAGQRQLVAFARAFLADPAVLILDEATSSLDVPSERLVQRALRTILADRTAVIIAHRLSTVEIADRVLVLEHGQVVEQGPPADLIASGQGRYSALHEAWVDSLA